MADDHSSRVLSQVLDQLESMAGGKSILVGRVVENLGRHSFASLMLVFALISTSPASAIPGITTAVAALVFLLIVQMIAGRKCVWLPALITHRRMSTAKLCKGVRWLRKPVEFVERFLKPRFTFLFHRPWIWLPMLLILGLTMAMPFMEAIPTSGSIASAVIAFLPLGCSAGTAPWCYFHSCCSWHFRWRSTTSGSANNAAGP
ncbi:exopolysaccharide biosynthesis protein [Rhizorhapis sp. SPR117]|uniref:exopolysaccharide biosynthesis protein n=1 Tax=Rhizorhapis sp. SPR117 TaxID=2912611 RepID=UPI001F365F2A|nr:exopolysaccharide biosynthesis protein [Rhizorhapis sp. SPR117]